MTKRDGRLKICVVGSGTRFLSGISYYTLRLANALADSHSVSAILMRQLIPKFLYPGRKRVGTRLTELRYAEDVPVYDGVDWHWLPSMFGALAFLIRERPEVMIFQWWTGTVLHSYLLLALVGRLLGARIIIEFHEVLDTAELRIPLVRLYLNLIARPFVALASGFVVHSEFDRPILKQRYSLGERPIEVIPHGPYDHYESTAARSVRREAPNSACNLLFFGVIRPYKGLEDLVRAFNSIPESDIERYWLTIVGESWEGWTLPLELIEQSPYRARITLVNRYVPDDEVAAYFAGADVVVLPYHRSSASGPLQVAMSYGLPVVVTDVGGLTEAAAHYDGGILVPSHNPTELLEGIEKAHTMRGQRFADPHSWTRTVAAFDGLLNMVQANGRPREVAA